MSIDAKKPLDLTRAAFDFVHDAQQIGDVAMLEARFHRVIAPHGARSFVASALMEHGGAPHPRQLFGRWRRDAERHYLENDFFRHDPAVTACFTRTRAFSWAELDAIEDLAPQSRRVMSEMREFGDRDGFVTPIHGVHGELASVLIAGPQLNLEPECQAVIHLASIYFFTAGRELAAASRLDDEPRGLSRRQAECLTWTARGLTRDEIADRLSISPATVTRHIEDAKAALGQRTTIEAVIHAIRRREIRP